MHACKHARSGLSFQAKTLGHTHALCQCLRKGKSAWHGMPWQGWSPCWIECAHMQARPWKLGCTRPAGAAPSASASSASMPATTYIHIMPHIAPDMRRVARGSEWQSVKSRKMLLRARAAASSGRYVSVGCYAPMVACDAAAACMQCRPCRAPHSPHAQPPAQPAEQRC